MSFYPLFTDGKLRLHRSDDIGSVDTDESLRPILASVKAGQEYLCSLDVDDIIEFLCRLSRLWSSRGNPIREQYSHLGLSFLLYWFREAHLKNALDVSFKGNRKVLDDFQESLTPDYTLAAFPRGVICHWIAGNVPMLGMLSLAQAMLTKNANILKVSREDGHVIPQLLGSFGEICYRNSAGRLIEGEKLAKSIAAIYGESTDNEFQRELSLIANVRVAWGGLEAVENVMNLPHRYGTEDVVFGPKTSFMVIGSEFLGSDESAASVAKKASVDASLLDQRGCNSPHTVFVETGNTVTPERFAELLAVEMEVAAARYPRGPMTTDDTMKVLSLRAEYKMRGQAYSSSANEWTVLYSGDDVGLATPCFNRTVFVRPIKNVMETEDFCSQITQSVGVALSADRKREFAWKVMSRGVARCPEIGSMTLYEVPWDGLFAFDRFVRWCRL